MAKETIPASPGKAAATVTDETGDAWAKWGAEVDRKLDGLHEDLANRDEALTKRLDAVEARVKEIAGLPKSKDGSKVDTSASARMGRIEQMLGLTSHVDEKDSEASDPAKDKEAGE